MLQSLQKKSLTTQQLWVKYRHSDVESSVILFSSSKVLTGFLRNLWPTFLFPRDSVWSTRRSDLKILLPVKKSWRVGEKMRSITARKKNSERNFVDWSWSRKKQILSSDWDRILLEGEQRYNSAKGNKCFMSAIKTCQKWHYWAWMISISNWIRTALKYWGIWHRHRCLNHYFQFVSEYLICELILK